MKRQVKVTPYMWNKDQKLKKKRNLCFEIIKEYCSSATLHGISYIGQRNKTLLERVWWILVFILSAIACFYLITKTWIKWTNNPVILSFEKEQTSIWEIPFPAVTVCPVNKIIQTKYNYTEMFRLRNNLTDEDEKYFWDISLVCHLEQFGVDFNCSFNVTDKFSIETIRHLAPDIESTVYSVTWRQRSQDPQIFAEQLTEEGLCFTFNSFSQKDLYTSKLTNKTVYVKQEQNTNGWTMEDGFPPDTQLTDPPFRTAKDGYASGLSFTLLAFQQDIDYTCGLSISGYKIILHNPAETPKASQQYFLIPLNRKVTLNVRPELTRTSKSLKSLTPHTRKCYFSAERLLRFYKVYTQQNCRSECNANLTEYFCGCVPFYEPRDDYTLICGYASYNCIKEIEDIVLYLEIKDNVENITAEEQVIINNIRKIYAKCDCLPSCTSLHYSAETSQTENHFVRTILASGLMGNELNADTMEKLNDRELFHTEVDIFFKDSQFLALQRSELYGQTDFLANCGGLLGLFMGFSILSLVEILYYSTLRLFVKYKTGA